MSNLEIIAALTEVIDSLSQHSHKVMPDIDDSTITDSVRSSLQKLNSLRIKLANEDTKELRLRHRVYAKAYIEALTDNGII